VFKVPDTIPDDIASFMDPLGNAVHSALSFDLIGEDVLITGAGPIGCMAAAVCKHVGARHIVVTDINDKRLGIAEECGATVGVNVGACETRGVGAVQQTMRKLNMKEGFDVALEMSGQKDAYTTTMRCLNNGGGAALLGIPAAPFSVDFNDVIFKGLTLKGIYGREMFETWYKMSQMLQNGLADAIRPALTHEFAAHDFKKAFAEGAGG
jgi:threonine 3-dehydrogenase